MELLKRMLFPVIMLLLAFSLWSSPQLQQIAAGVAIFLFGMLSLERGFQSFSGGLIERVLQRSTNTTGKALLFGVAINSTQTVEVVPAPIYWPLTVLRCDAAVVAGIPFLCRVNTFSSVNTLFPM